MRTKFYELALAKLYDSEGTISDPINAKLASLVDKMVKNSLSEEK